MDPGSLAHLQPYVRLARDEWRSAWRIGRRRIPDYLVVAILEGKGRFTVDDQDVAVGPMDVVWIPPGVTHVLEGFAPRMHVLWAHLDLTWQAALSPRRPIPGGGADDLAALRPWMHPPVPVRPIAAWCGRLALANAPAVVEEVRRIAIEDQGMRHALLQAGNVLRLLGQIELGLSAASRRTPHWQELQRCAEQLRSAPERPVSLRALAGRLRLSPSHFRALFTAVHGVSPRAIQAQARIQRACEIIRYSGTSPRLTTLARQLGFSSVHSFSRAFRRTMGVAPRRWRAGA